MASGINITLMSKDNGAAAIQKVAWEFGQMEKQVTTAAARLSEAWGQVKVAAAVVAAAEAALHEGQRARCAAGGAAGLPERRG